MDQCEKYDSNFNCLECSEGSKIIETIYKLVDGEYKL